MAIAKINLMISSLTFLWISIALGASERKASSNDVRVVKTTGPPPSSTDKSVVKTTVSLPSTTDKPDIKTTEKSSNVFYLELDRPGCRDRYRKCTEEKCEKYNTGEMRRNMRRVCKKTCGYCRQQSPPACFSSPYGCCWDFITSALGPGGKGCPPCGDSERYPYICKRFRTYCRRPGISGKWMRSFCPDSCGHCAIWQF